MSGTDIHSFMANIQNAVDAQDGMQLAYQLNPMMPHAKELVRLYKKESKDSLNRFKTLISQPWGQIGVQYILVCTHIKNKHHGDAFVEHTALITLFYRYFEESTGWTLETLYSLLRNLRDLALDSDLEVGKTQTADKMEAAARTIQKAYTMCLTDKSPDQSRKWGVYYLIGLILKCYFKIGRIALAKNILAPLNVHKLPWELSQYPKSHQVTYHYYLGMLSFLNEDYAKSEQEFSQAFYDCPEESHRHVNRILTYLVPLRILKGHLPSEELMMRYPFVANLFGTFVDAIRTGDLQKFDDAVEIQEKQLLQLNLYITIEKAREACMRSYLRKVWIWAGKESRLPIATFHGALRLRNPNMDVAETECILANLIFKGYIRGYMSHALKMIVLANTNAFPRLADRPEPFKELL